MLGRREDSLVNFKPRQTSKKILLAHFSWEELLRRSNTRIRDGRKRSDEFVRFIRALRSRVFSRLFVRSTTYLYLGCAEQRSEKCVASPLRSGPLRPGQWRGTVCADRDTQLGSPTFHKVNLLPAKLSALKEQVWNLQCEVKFSTFCAPPLYAFYEPVPLANSSS